jgi:methylated-DNA-[protein]-cysteine S-methyltransferase
LRAHVGIDLEPPGPALLAAASQPGQTLFDSPIGPVGIAWAENRIVAVVLPGAGETDTRSMLAALAPGGTPGVDNPPPTLIARGIDAMVDLLSGTRRDLSEVLVDLGDLSAFDAEVYAVTRTIPPGSVMTYGAVARHIGHPDAARAVGAALSRNPVPLVVPCHRVVAGDGTLGGFSANGGVITKRRLLEIEGAPINRTLF